MAIVSFIVGIGGSANDGTAVSGYLQALGYDFLDKNGAPVGYGGGANPLLAIRLTMFYEVEKKFAPSTWRVTTRCFVVQ